MDCCAVLCCVSAGECVRVYVYHYISVNNILTYNKASRQMNRRRYVHAKVIAFAIRCQGANWKKRGSEKGCHCRLMIIIVKLMQTINMLYAWVRACKIVLKLGSHYNGNSIESYTVTMNFSEPANVLYIVLSALFVFCRVYFDVTIWLEEDFWFSRLHRSTIDSKIMK